MAEIHTKIDGVAAGPMRAVSKQLAGALAGDLIVPCNVLIRLRILEDNSTRCYQIEVVKLGSPDRHVFIENSGQHYRVLFMRKGEPWLKRDGYSYGSKAEFNFDEYHRLLGWVEEALSSSEAPATPAFEWRQCRDPWLEDANVH